MYMVLFSFFVYVVWLLDFVGMYTSTLATLKN